MFTGTSLRKAANAKTLTGYARHIAPRPRRFDFVLGILGSAMLHGGLFFGGLLLPEKNAAPPAPKVEETVIQIIMPSIPEEEPEEIADLAQEEPGAPSFAPPTLMDVPSIGPLTAFVQPLQPPPPQGLEVSKGLSSIPVTRGTGSALGKGMKDLFDVASLDQVPSPRATVQPNYPFELKRTGTTGHVLVEFIVDTRGDVVAAEVVRSSDAGFEQATLEAVRRWKFQAGRKNGRYVNTRVRQLVTFNLTAPED